MTEETEKLVDALEEHARKLGVPSHLTGGIAWYVCTGRPMGSFLTAVFADKLMDAVCLADPKSLESILYLARFIYNELPGSCHGSPAAVSAWIKKGGDPEWVPDSMERVP